jgi:hypothetical protein
MGHPFPRRRDQGKRGRRIVGGHLSSGSRATLTAIRRASSFVSTLACLSLGRLVPFSFII